MKTQFQHFTIFWCQLSQITYIYLYLLDQLIFPTGRMPCLNGIIHLRVWPSQIIKTSFSVFIVLCIRWSATSSNNRLQTCFIKCCYTFKGLLSTASKDSAPSVRRMLHFPFNSICILNHVFKTGLSNIRSVQDS